MKSYIETKTARLIMWAAVALLLCGGTALAVCTRQTWSGTARKTARAQATPPAATATVEPVQATLILPWSPELAEPQSLFDEPEYKQRPQRAAPYPLEAGERDLVERVVAAEAAGEDFDGQCLVAQCIRNTAEAKHITPEQVVTEKNQYAAPSEEATDRVKRAVAAVFDEGYRVTNEPIRWFYAPRYSAGRWHESALVFVLEHGGHRFFKEGEK